MSIFDPNIIKSPIPWVTRVQNEFTPRMFTWIKDEFCSSYPNREIIALGSLDQIKSLLEQQCNKTSKLPNVLETDFEIGYINVHCEKIPHSRTKYEISFIVHHINIKDGDGYLCLKIQIIIKYTKREGYFIFVNQI